MTSCTWLGPTTRRWISRSRRPGCSQFVCFILATSITYSHSSVLITTVKRFFFFFEGRVAHALRKESLDLLLIDSAVGFPIRIFAELPGRDIRCDRHRSVLGVRHRSCRGCVTNCVLSGCKRRSLRFTPSTIVPNQILRIGSTILVNDIHLRTSRISGDDIVLQSVCGILWRDSECVASLSHRLALVTVHSGGRSNKQLGEEHFALAGNCIWPFSGLRPNKWGPVLLQPVCASV
jgi:hypothetical protein